MVRREHMFWCCILGVSIITGVPLSFLPGSHNMDIQGAGLVGMAWLCFSYVLYRLHLHRRVYRAGLSMHICSNSLPCVENSGAVF